MGRLSQERPDVSRRERTCRDVSEVARAGKVVSTYLSGAPTTRYGNSAGHSQLVPYLLHGINQIRSPQMFPVGQNQGSASPDNEEYACVFLRNRDPASCPGCVGEPVQKLRLFCSAYPATRRFQVGVEAFNVAGELRPIVMLSGSHKR